MPQRTSRTLRRAGNRVVGTRVPVKWTAQRGSRKQLMKNVWKGLILGALTGMVGGAVLDAAAGARRKTAVVAHDVIDKAPRIVRSATHKAVDMLHDANVPETLKDAAVRTGDSHAAKRAKRAVSQVAAGLGH